MQVFRFYDAERAEEKNVWISAFCTKLDSYLLKKSKEFVAQGYLQSVKINPLTSRVEVVSEGQEIILSKV